MKQPYKKGMVLFTVILMDLLVGMELDLFVPSFPELQSHFNLTPFWVEALVSINFLGYCLSLFFVGALADRFGRKPIILLGLITFIIGSLFCLWAPFYILLLIGRLLQGIGIAAPAILSFLIIADSYPMKKQQFYIAMLNGLKNVSVAAAPVAGSYITLYYNWRGNFTTLLLFGIMATALTVFCIPNYKLPEHKETLSLRSYIPLFQSKPMLLLILHITFLFVPYWIFVGLSPLLYMKDLGVSLQHFGFYQGSLALTYALGSVLFGLFIHRIDQKKILIVSNYMLLTGLMLIILLCFVPYTPAIIITLVLLFFEIGHIVPSTIIYPLALNYMPEMKGRVSGMIHGSSVIFQAIGLQTAGYYYNGTFRPLGLIMGCFILLIIVTLFMIIRNREMMGTLKEVEKSI